MIALDRCFKYFRRAVAPRTKACSMVAAMSFSERVVNTCKRDARKYGRGTSAGTTRMQDVPSLSMLSCNLWTSSSIIEKFSGILYAICLRFFRPFFGHHNQYLSRLLEIPVPTWVDRAPCTDVALSCVAEACSGNYSIHHLQAPFDQILQLTWSCLL